MRWQSGRRSDNVEDRRGMSLGRGAAFGGLGLFGTLVVVVLAMLFGVDPRQLLEGGGTGPGISVDDGRMPSGMPAGPGSGAPGEDELKDFASVVLGETEVAWGGLFAQSGAQYREPRMVLFTGAVDSACGSASSAVGPFYCPADERVYLDLSFFDQLAAMGGAGDFARAYVIAHEVGHHVQNLSGMSSRVAQAQQGLPREEANALSVRLELQADCYAGVWAAHVQRERGLIEPGDIDEALRAASAIGDDTLQRRGQGHVVPETFTHGTSAQRREWFHRGLESGSPAACDTFRGR